MSALQFHPIQQISYGHHGVVEITELVSNELETLFGILCNNKYSPGSKLAWNWFGHQNRPTSEWSSLFFARV